MARSSAYRKYQLTINNPIDKGYSHEVLKSIIATFRSCLYWCMSDEIGESETLHTHIFLAFKNAVEFSTIHKRFYQAHIEQAHGSFKENRDYITKEGKWSDDLKHGTRIEGTFEESGDLPEEESKSESISSQIIQMIKDGHTDIEIIDAFPTYLNHLRNLDTYRQSVLQDKYNNVFRQLEIHYIWGKTGIGKTRSVMETYGYKNVYRVTDYVHPFDSYNGQPVILFDEFRSDLPIKDMLKYLDGYPLMLPCRFSNKAACYEKVYVISNIPFDKQYPNIQIDEPETWNALKRRFNYIMEMTSDNAIEFGEVKKC